MINKGILIDRQFDAELFADNLRLLREGKGLTQAELGSLCGISENAIRNYELGRCFPKITTLNALADALDVSVGSICIYLFDNDLELQAGLRQICQVYGLRVKTCPIEDKKQKLQTNVGQAQSLRFTRIGKRISPSTLKRELRN